MGSNHKSTMRPIGLIVDLDDEGYVLNRDGTGRWRGVWTSPYDPAETLGHDEVVELIGEIARTLVRDAEGLTDGDRSETSD